MEGEAPLWVQLPVTLAVAGVLTALVGFLVRGQRERARIRARARRRAAAGLPDVYQLPPPPRWIGIAMLVTAAVALVVGAVAGYQWGLALFLLALLWTVPMARHEAGWRRTVADDVRRQADREPAELPAILERLEAVHGRGFVRWLRRRMRRQRKRSA